MSKWIMDIQALDPEDNEVVLRFSDSAFIDVDDNYYDNRLEQAALFTNQAFTGAVLQGSRSGFGEAVLINTDGALNGLVDYAVDGRGLSLSLEDDGTITKYIQATALRLVDDNNKIRVILRDPQANIDEPHPLDVFAGTNVLPAGIEGTADDIKGSKKPKVFGKVRSASPVLVNTSKLIYQVSSLSADVVAVYDRGASLTRGANYPDLATMESTAPSAGQYRTYQGYFRLGSSPVGTVTCDVDSSANAGDVFSQIAAEASITVEASDLAPANAIGEVGIFLQDDTTTASLMDLIANSIGFYWYFNNDEVVRLLPLSAPATEDFEVNVSQILDITRESTGAGSNGLPIYQVRVLADKIETVQTDLAGSVPAATVARLSAEYREAKFTSSTVKARHRLSEELVITSCLRSLVDAQAVANTLGALLSVRRDKCAVTARVDDQFDIGRVVKVVTPKLGYVGGRKMIILGHTVDAKRRRVTFNLWG